VVNEPLEICGQSVEPVQLGSVDLFQELDSAELGRLAGHFAELLVPVDHLIVQEGESAAAFFVVTKGGFVVFRDARGEPVRLLARLRSRDFFGELGLFGSGRHTASVRAFEPSQVLRITKVDFLRFLEGHPQILEKLQVSATRRHTANIASSLELGRRREVRIRCAREVNLGLSEGKSKRVVVENLSVGGVCFSQAPRSWEKGKTVSFSLAVRENGLLLSGRVVWRHEDSLGIVFTKQSPNHDMIVQMAIRLLVESPC
jgi:CRP-like cAMP-binding protein